jgi:RimJ/RimL family protein N-acetyltransferase
MSVPFMLALGRRDMRAASDEIGAAVPEWLAEQLDGFVKYRLGQLDKDLSLQSWLGRALVITDGEDGRRVIGSIGFHGPPDESGRLEIGYSVDPGYRRQGFAREAVRTMFDWAHANHGVDRFLASISPNNEPSLRLAEQFGFVRIGEQMDEIDGLEYVFETRWPPDS